MKREAGDFIEIIGEAVKSIPDDIKKKYPEIPWKGMAGLGTLRCFASCPYRVT